MSGEFIFDDGVAWGADSSLSSCNSNKKRTAKYRSEGDDWLNARNWQAHNLGDGSEIHVQDFLDTENVPCDFDQVSFSDDTAWTVKVDSDLTLNRITVAGQRYDTQTFHAYRETGRGVYQFTGDGVITVNPTTCQDVTGCYCRAALFADEINKLICDNTPCGTASCQQPLRPTGQCCPVCGGMLTMKFDSAVYTEAAMDQFLNEQTVQFAGAHFALSKQRSLTFDVNDEAFVQLMLTDEGTGADSGSQAKALTRKLHDLLLDPSNNLGVSEISMSISGAGISGGMSSGAIAGIVIGILLLVSALAGVGYLCSKKGTPDFKLNLPTAFFNNKQQGEENPMYEYSSNDGSNDGSDTTPGSSNKDSTTTVSQQVTKDTGLPGALESDFGVSFPNPSYVEEDL